MGLDFNIFLIESILLITIGTILGSKLDYYMNLLRVKHPTYFKLINVVQISISIIVIYLFFRFNDTIIGRTNDLKGEDILEVEIKDLLFFSFYFNTQHELFKSLKV